jgi:EAL domain-containing protein (putative c-di-GMP-specific phosphodiesterase class I)
MGAPCGGSCLSPGFIQFDDPSGQPAMNPHATTAIPIDTLDALCNRHSNDQLFLDWVLHNAVPHIKTRLDGEILSCHGLHAEYTQQALQGMPVQGLVQVAPGQTDLAVVLQRLARHLAQGRIGITLLKTVQSCTEVWVAHEEGSDVLILPLREGGQTVLCWIEVQAITSYKFEGSSKAQNQLFTIANLDMVVGLKKSYNFSARNRFFGQNRGLFQDSKFDPQGSFNPAVRLTESWADLVEFIQDDGFVDVYKLAVRQLFNDVGQPVGYVSVAQLASGKSGADKAAAPVSTSGMGRSVVSSDDLKTSVEECMAQALVVKSGFSLILLEIQQDPSHQPPEEASFNQFVNKFLNRIQKVIRRNDVVACLSPSTFAILLKYINSPAALDRIISYFKREFADHLGQGDAFAHLKLHGGCASFPLDGKSTLDILDKVNVALDLSRLHFGSEIYQWKNVSSHVREDRLSRDLIQALVHNELHLTFQPQIDFQGNALIKAVEVSPEWNHPIFGQVLPAEIYRLATSNGLIVSLGEWLFGQTFKEMDNLVRECGHDVTLSFGVVSPDMLDKAWIARLLDVAKAAGVATHQISLDIPEALLTDEHDASKLGVLELKQLGFQLSIDNFGLHNFNLLQLSKTPVDVLKLDRRFVADVVASDKNLSIIRCVINMAHALGLNVVSCGADSVAQIEALYRSGCFVFQGALTGQRMTLPELMAWKVQMPGLIDLRDQLRRELPPL